MNFRMPAGERNISLLSSFLLFAATAAYIILKSGRDALFLSDYSARTLPYFMAIATIVTAFLAAGYLRLYKILPLNAAIDLSFKIFAVGTLVLWAAVKARWAHATPVLYVWTDVFGAVAPLQAWSLISQQLLTRQAKRAFGIIGAGGIAGASVGGFFARIVSQTSGVSALLPTATILIVLALFACQILATMAPISEAGNRQRERLEVRPRFITLVVIVVGIGSIISTFSDFQFKVIAQRELGTAQSLASFFGSFYAYVGIATLVFQLLITPAVMNRLGVASAMSFLPLGLATGNVMLLATQSLFSVVVLKGSQQMFKNSIDRSSLEVLYMAIPDHAKVRLKSIIDTLGIRVAEGAAAVFLIVLFSVGNFPLAFLAIVSLVLVVLSIAGTIMLGREYPKALKTAINQSEVSLSGIKAEFFTTDFYRLVPDLLVSDKKETVLDLLQVLGSSRALKGQLPALLKHVEADVRLKALQLLFGQEEDCSLQVELLISDPDRRVRVEAIHYLCFRSSIDPLEKLAHLLSDPEPTIQAAACACSLNQELEPVQKLAYTRLEELLSSSVTQSEVRLEVAHILEYVKPSSSSNELRRKLLSDPSIEVRKATLNSLAKTAPPEILPALIKCLPEKALRKELREALSGYGESALPILNTVLKSGVEPLEHKKMALRIAADIGTPAGVQMLFANALGPNLVLRFISIKALNRLHKRRQLQFDRAQVLALVDQELTALQLEQERSRYVSPDSGGLLEAVLQQRETWARERIFRVLGLMYEQKAIYNAYQAVSGDDRRRADAALEFLDSTLTPEHRHRLLPLLERKSRSQKRHDTSGRRSILFGYIGARDELPAAAVIAGFSQEEIASWKNEIEETLRNFPNLPLVEETFRWRSMQMDSKNKLTTIEKLEDLSKIDIFSKLGPQDLLLLANQCTEAEFQAGDTIFNEGDEAHDIFALALGSVQLYRSTGPKATIKSGQSFGALSVLGETPRFFSAKALERCLCLKIDAQTFWEIIEDYPAISQSIFKLLAGRLRTLIGTQ